MKSMPVAAELIKKEFCENDYSNCARHYLFTYLEKKDLSVDKKTEDIIAKLSDTLYPHELNKVKKALPDSK
jgi:hypothetical protein